MTSIHSLVRGQALTIVAIAVAAAALVEAPVTTEVIGIDRVIEDVARVIGRVTSRQIQNLQVGVDAQ